MDYIIFRHRLAIGDNYLPKQNFKSEGRESVVFWLLDLSQKLKLQPATFFRAVNILDRYWAKHRILTADYYIIANAALCLAYIFHEPYVPELTDLTGLPDGQLSETDLCYRTHNLFTALDGDVGGPLIIHFGEFLLTDKGNEHILLYILTCSVFNYKLAAVSMPLIAAAGVKIVEMANGAIDNFLTQMIGRPIEEINLVVEEILSTMDEFVIVNQYFPRVSGAGFIHGPKNLGEKATAVSSPSISTSRHPGKFYPHKPQGYEKTKILGRGKYGKIFKILHQSSKQIYTCKEIISPQGEINYSAMIEIAILLNLHHRNIICPLAIHIRQSPICKIYIIYDYCLADLSNWKVTSDQYLQIILQIIQGIEYIHNCGILHRDIKPQNILIDDDGIVKIADFGLSKIMDGGPKTASMFTLPYRPPELLYGSDRYNQSADIWAYGCTIVEILNRKPLFGGVSGEIATLEQIAKILGTPSPPPDVSPIGTLPIYPLNSSALNINDELLLDLVIKILHLDPRHRLTAAQIINHEYFQ